MSFRIFAAGSRSRGGPFNYSRAGLDIGDIYELADALSGVATVPVRARVAREGLRAAARSVATDEVVDQLSVTSPHEHAVTAMGHLHGAHLFATNLTLLIADHAPLELFIAVRGESGLLTGTPTGYVRMRFRGDEVSPAGDLLRALGPVLAECGMNGFGVLSGLARVFVAYDGEAGLGSDGWYRLNIDVNAT